jgi:hypothetical protein
MTRLPDLSQLPYREKAERIMDLREVGYSDDMIARILGWSGGRRTVQNQLHKSLNWKKTNEYRVAYRQRVRAIRPPKPNEAMEFWLQDGVKDDVVRLWPKMSAAKIAHYLSEKYGRPVTRNAVIGKTARWELPAKKKFYIPKRSEDDVRSYPIRYADARRT